jgi:hypothetical protein
MALEQSQSVPPITSRIRPAGTVSVIVTVPLVGPVPTFDTVTVYAAPLSPTVNVPSCDLLIASTGPVGAAVVNVAVTVSAPAGILNVHVVAPTVHAVGVPLQPPNAPPAGGVSVRVTAVLNVAFTEQSTIPAAGPQLMVPSWGFTALLVTVPPWMPARFTVSKKVFIVNSAVALVAVVLLTTNAQVAAVVPLHGPAIQLLNE